MLASYDRSSVLENLEGMTYHTGILGLPPAGGGGRTTKWEGRGCSSVSFVSTPKRF